MPLSERQFIFTCEAFFPDMFFHCVHCTEQGQCLLRQCLVGNFRIEKFRRAWAMQPTIVMPGTLA
jgi:hypothetical protein